MDEYIAELQEDLFAEKEDDNKKWNSVVIGMVNFTFVVINA